MLVAHDYESKAKPSCDWSDPDSRSELINGLVTDGLAVIEAVEGHEVGSRTGRRNRSVRSGDGPGCGTGSRIGKADGG